MMFMVSSELEVATHINTRTENHSLFILIISENNGIRKHTNCMEVMLLSVGRIALLLESCHRGLYLKNKVTIK